MLTKEVHRPGRTSMRTYRGLEIDMLDPQPEQIDLGDIAHALALTCRFGGHTMKHYSVAEHSVAVAQCLVATGNGEHARAGILHDAAEAYIGDVISPMRRALEALGGCAALNELEARFLRAIGKRFDVVLDPLPAVVKAADAAVFTTEFESVARHDRLEMPWYDAEVLFICAARIHGVR